jgi:dTDP-4-dehydrorhamnose 3,5-epimerase
MKLTRTRIPEVMVLEPRVFVDDRGFFLESYNQKTFAELDLTKPFVQDNHSHSSRNVLRGMHYQLGRPQGKLVRVVAGAIWDVALDVRRSSATYGQWVCEELSAENKRMLWVPEGFAHGYLVISDSADVLYKATDFYAPRCECSILWNDPALAIQWPLSGEPLLSEKDRAGTALSQSEVFD